MLNMQSSYKKPSLQYWDAKRLNSIEATMSGGGGGGGTIYYNVYIVNNPSFLIGVAGHSALLFCASSYSKCQLYSFHPHDNHTNPADGALAYIANSDDAKSFSSFRSACNADKGILLENNTGWSDYEKFTRYIKLGVTYTKYSAMLNKCIDYKKNPPPYSGLGSDISNGINCQGFINHILSSQGIVLKNDAGISLASNIVPNEIMEYMSTASGVAYTEKNVL